MPQKIFFCTKGKEYLAMSLPSLAKRKGGKHLFFKWYGATRGLSQSCYYLGSIDSLLLTHAITCVCRKSRGICRLHQLESDLQYRAHSWLTFVPLLNLPQVQICRSVQSLGHLSSLRPMQTSCKAGQTVRTNDSTLCYMFAEDTY